MTDISPYTTIAVRPGCGTFIARCRVGKRVVVASCTIGEDEAAEACAKKLVAPMTCAGKPCDYALRFQDERAMPNRNGIGSTAVHFYDLRLITDANALPKVKSAPTVNDIIEYGNKALETGRARTQLQGEINRLQGRGVPFKIFIAVGRATVIAMSDASMRVASQTVGQIECRYCGCTVDFACQFHPEVECSWFNDDPHAPVCSNPECVTKFEREKLHA